MNPDTINSPSDRVMQIACRYISVDGYFSRSEEISLRGTLAVGNQGWKESLTSELKAVGYAVRTYQDDAVVHLNIYPARRPLPWINLALFLATLVSVSYSYTFQIFLEQGIAAGIQAFNDTAAFLQWQYFAIPLMLILLFHEFGHYLAARRRGIRVSLPFFLPAPTFIGTFGAFIKTNSPFTSRRDLLEVGAYGPIAGFVVAVVVLYLGMSNIAYRIAPPGMETGGLVEPLVMRIIEYFALAQDLPDGHVIFLQDNPLVLAAWVGLFVTTMNLLPVGQLDGGHIVYALSPRKHAWISRGVWSLLLGMGFFWPGWWMWATLVYFVIKFRHPPTLNDQQPLERRSRWIGWTAMAIFLLTFSPVPF